MRTIANATTCVKTRKRGQSHPNRARADYPNAEAAQEKNNCSMPFSSTYPKFPHHLQPFGPEKHPARKGITRKKNYSLTKAAA